MSGRCARFSVWNGGVLALVVCLSILPLPAVDAGLRTELVNDYWVTGYLVWTEAGRGISWDENSLSQDGIGQPNPATPPPVPPLESDTWSHSDSESFVSEPVPRDILLNVSRHIQVNLYSAKSCQFLNVALRVSGRQLAGQLAPQSMPNAIPYYPAPPSNTCVRYFRMHPELDRIPAGSTITLTVSYRLDRSSPETPKYRLQDDPRSVVRFPFYPPEEAVPRLREHVWTDKGTETRVEAKAGAGDYATAGASGLAPLALIWPSGVLRRRLVRGVAFCILTTSLAGCTGAGDRPQSDAESGGFASQTVVPNPNDVTGADGRLVGTVHDDLNISLPGVFVTFLDRDAFTKTDGRGVFSFASVPSGVHRLRFERAEHRAFETEAEVFAGHTSVLDVTMRLLVDRGSDFRRHPHNYWLAGENNRTITSNLEVVDGQPSSADAGFVLPDLHGAPGLIIPGTRDVEIVVTWSNPNQEASDRVGVMFRANNDNNQGNFSYLEPRPSGQVFHIRTNWEMTDVGHQKYSTWDLRLYRLHAFAGPYRVSITIHRGALPMEPPHPDYWKNGDTLLILDAAYIRNPSGGSPNPNKPSFPTIIVPPGTKWLEIILEQNWDTQREWHPLYQSDPRQDWATPVLVNPRGSLRSDWYAVLASDFETDAHYQKKSLWLFDREPDPTDTPEKVVAEQMDNVTGNGLTTKVGFGNQAPRFDVTVFAHARARSEVAG